MLKENVVSNYTDIDYSSWGVYQSAQDMNWGDLVFNSTRLAYLFFL